jgi:GTPase SAR1 family protein
MSLKVAIIGTTGVGKTQFIERLEGKPFVRCYNVTEQYDIRNICYQGTDIEFRDFAGTQSYITDNDLFFNLDVLLLMVDDTKISYENVIKRAIKIMRKYSPKRVMLIKNKIDIRIDNYRLLSRAYKISVKTNEGIQELMDDVILTH